MARAADDSRRPPHTRVDLYAGKPVIFVDDQPLPFTAYSPTADPGLFFEQTRRFFAHDTRVFFLHLPAADVPGDFFANPFWVGDRIHPRPVLPLRLVSLEDQARFILEHKPEAYLFIRFGPYEPQSWLEAHPEEWFVSEDGVPLPHASLASRRYWNDSASFIESVVRWCEGQEFAHRIIGYWTGHKIEGSHAPVMKGLAFDHGPAMTRRWREYLHHRYGDDAALRRAWDDPSVSLADAPIPRDLFRRPLPEIAGDPYWKTGPRSAATRDYFDLARQLFHEGFRIQADAHRRAVQRPCVFVVDALKQAMMGWDNHSFFESGVSWPLAYIDMQVGAGNVAVAELLTHPGIDGVITPHDYQARGLGGVCEPEAVADSLVHRGKLHLCEMDVRSDLGDPRRLYFAARDVQEFAAITWRNLATAITRGFHGYLMDVYTDWFADPAIHEVIHRQFEVQVESLHWIHADVPGIAVILDDDAYRHTNFNGAFLNEAVMWELKGGLARCGVPFRTYLLDDVIQAGLPPHRVIYFPNLFFADKARSRWIAEQVCCEGRVVIWGPGSGISNGCTISPDHAATLTGFTFELLPGNLQRRAIVSDYAHPVTAEMDEGVILGSPLAYGPALFPCDGRRLADAWTQQGRDLAALAVKDQGEWTSVFTAIVPLPARLWRGLARHAGAHLYTQSYDVILADAAAVALHSIRPGPKTLHLPAPARVTDLVTGRVLEGVRDRIEFELTAAATAFFRTEPA